MKITKTQLRQIIKEEVENTLVMESVKQFIKNSKIHSTIPFSVLPRIMKDNPELAQAVRNPADPRAQAEAMGKLAELFGSYVDPNSKMSLGDGMDVRGFLRYAEQKGML
jgi:hypothetical protein